MMRRAMSLLALGSTLASVSAFAEEDEVSVGIEAGLVLPAFESPDPTAFALATWAVSGFAQYGVVDWLYATGRLSFSAYSAEANATEMFRGRSLEGTLSFDLLQLHPELGLRAKLYGGYNLAPYFEASVGLLWAIYRNQDLRNDQGQSFGLELEDEGEGRFTISAGLGVDYRLANLFFVGAAVRYVEVIGGGRFRRYLAAPVQFSVYW